MAAADRELLFGLLALQNGLIEQGQLVAAFQAWARDRRRPIADHLVSRGALDAEQCACSMPSPCSTSRSMATTRPRA